MKPLQQRLETLDNDIKAAVAQLKRIPDDLYDLAVADVRELRKEREQASEKLQALEWKSQEPKADSEELVTKALERLHGLRERIESSDPKVVRHAMQSLVERIDPTFDHIHYPKITRSVVRKGVVHFRVAESYNQPRLPVQLCNFLESLVFTADDLPAIQYDHRVTPGVDAAESFLRRFLTNEAKHSSNIVAAAEHAGISRSIIYRARNRIGLDCVSGFWSIV